VRIAVLGSGSGGNCTLLESHTTQLLVDAGFGPRSLKRRLKEAGLRLNKIDAILLTHGHSDHVAGVSSLLKEFKGATVYMNAGTREEVPVLGKIGKWEEFESETPFTVGDFTVKAFDVPHDAAQPVGFSVSSNGTSGVLATDLGELNSSIEKHLEGRQWMALESNHDEELLKIGPYPWELKRRVLSRRGHLSNKALADFLRHRFDGSATHLFLAHLSRQNNEPNLAFSAAWQAVRDRHPLFGRPDMKVHLTHQSKPSIVLDL
jgi:phosphoribosyl 1,2-cyclic phosphodiesterase